MGNFSRDDTFDESKHYVGVRLQQGVPLVDADWNEAFDIRKHELRTFLREFVGDGVPKGSDGFHIIRIPGDMAFWIKEGRCLVDGWEVINESTLRYTDQRLFKNATLADAWEVHLLDALSIPPTGTAFFLAYLDVWEREVNANDASEPGVLDHLINPAIGIETCVRTKREWVVRAIRVMESPGEDEDQDLQADPHGFLHRILEEEKIHQLGHAYYPLALLLWLDWNLTHVLDLRQTGLAVLSKAITIEDDNVGIGTTSPEGLLHVSAGKYGDALFILEADTENLKKEESTEAEQYQPLVELRQDGSLTKGWFGFTDGKNDLKIGAGTGNEKNSIVFHTGSHETQTEKMRLTNDGKLGIGTTEPGARLDIAKTGTGTGDKWFSAGDGGGYGRMWLSYGWDAEKYAGNSYLNNGAPLLVLSAQGNPPLVEFQQTGNETEEEPQFRSWIGHAAGKSSDIAISTGPEKEPPQERLRITSSGNVGIGTDAPETILHVKGARGDASIEPPNNIVYIENTQEDNADILLLKIQESEPGGSFNFITFKGGDEVLGRINGGSGGVTCATTGGDYAEWLSRLRENETIAEGDIVGVVRGKVTKVTEGAHHVMAISRAPAILGNMPDEGSEHLYEKVAFLGQVRVKVRGPVQAGDYIIPSGQNNGTGVAIPPHDMTFARYAQVVGRAWESSDEEGMKRINTAVGFQPVPSCPESLAATLRSLQEEVATLKKELESR